MPLIICKEVAEAISGQIQLELELDECRRGQSLDPDFVNYIKYEVSDDADFHSNFGWRAGGGPANGPESARAQENKNKFPPSL
jgi:hypothetical protein